MTKSEKIVPQNCWDFMECPPTVKEKCIAYKNNAGKGCWFFWTATGGCPVIRNGEGCINCLWFKENNPEKFDKIF